MPSKEDLYDRAIDLVAEGRADEAVAAYREALALDPVYVDAWTGLALALGELRRFDEAIEAGKKLVELEPDDPLSYTNLSRFYQQLGNVPEAEAWAAKARIADWKQQIRESDKDKTPA
jgi:tetratricopeptide (TPR) repeat protein